MRPLRASVARVVRIVRTGDTEGIELMVASLAIAWGAWVLLPFERATDASHRAMLGFAPEWLWGIAYVFVGILGWVSVVVHGSRLRMWATRLEFFGWLFLTIFYLRYSAALPVSAVALAVAIFAAGVHLRLRGATP